MYIDNLTIAALVVFVIAMVMFVKTCFIMNCMRDDKTGSGRDVEPGDEQ